MPPRRSQHQRAPPRLAAEGVSGACSATKRESWRLVASIRSLRQAHRCTKAFHCRAPGQAMVEGTLDEEESARNGRRLDLMYMSTSHPLAPDIFELVDAAAAARGEGEDAAGAAERVIDPKLTGARLPSRLPGLIWLSGCRQPKHCRRASSLPDRGVLFHGGGM